jgi:hypothetical protein
MRDVQFWLYVIVGVIYLLSRLRKKPDEKPKDLPNYRPESPVQKYEQPSAKPTVSPGKALTFEELLREISESKSPAPAPQPRQEYVDYDDNLGEEAQDLEEVGYDYRKKDKIYDVYEDAKKQAFNRLSLEETMKVGDTDMKFGKFKEFEQEAKRDLMKEYLADFKDPEGMRKAVVMSEILQRKF